VKNCENLVVLKLKYYHLWLNQEPSLLQDEKVFSPKTGKAGGTIVCVGAHRSFSYTKSWFVADDICMWGASLDSRDLTNE